MGFGKILVIVGIVLLLAGGLVMLLTRLGLPPGGLPGDMAYRGRNFSFFFPLGTSLLLSIILSLVFYLLNRFRR